jgi:two-component system, OmpR family, response regulator
MRLLVVEDEADLAQAIVAHLVEASHAADHVSTADDALAAIRTTNYDLILLDLQLPDGDGLSVLHDLRERKERTPVLIATARDRITERIAGLDEGADDYLVKPYDLDEMLARIAAILRRAVGDGILEREFGNIRINSATKSVYLGAKKVDLTRKEWALLDRLSRRPGITHSKSELEDAIYSFGSEVESNAIEAHISRLRAKLGRTAVETVRGFGYRIGRS